MSFSELGFELIENYLDSAELNKHDNALAGISLPRAVGGIRNAEKKYACISSFVSSVYALEQAQKYLNGEAKFVRAILFNKTPDSNWLVSWHQDKTVSVSEKFISDGWGPWSIKGGVHHVQPPLEVLNSMVTFRIHLDDTSLENGCLSVVPGSNGFGILTQQEISERSSAFNPVLCSAPAGSALVMRPHLMHSSSKGTMPKQRRVVHIEYSSYKLPSGVTWA